MKKKVNRSYSHKELFCLYFPGSTLHSASTQLSKWITRDKELREVLAGAGYIPRQR
ncbi:MAG: DUF4248 domain-containing protein [Tannerellaceae bacterium]|nr:DUF4248 domain-containing protein [Tannerellaceae bacterium]MCD8263527.1 DUF4248 domain-containing protein [Tannerellaceae bacterium]